MFRSARIVATVSAVTIAACASSLWAERRTVKGAPFAGTLHVPRLFAPVVPGSVYPDRKRPVAALGRPGVVVVAPRALTAVAAEPLGHERLVVLHLDTGGQLAAARTWLAKQPECEGGRLALVLVAPEEIPALEGWAAVAVVNYEPSDRPRQGERPAATPPRAAFFVTSSGVPREDLAARAREDLGPGVVEKWYRSERPEIPAEIWRDVAGFLEGELERGTGTDRG